MQWDILKFTFFLAGNNIVKYNICIFKIFGVKSYRAIIFQWFPIFIDDKLV